MNCNILSHEIRNVLNRIIQISKQLKDSNSSENTTLINELYTATNIVSDLMQSDKCVTSLINVSELLSNIMSTMNISCDKKITVVYKPSIVLSDRAKLTSILCNLIQNAIKYSKTYIKVEISYDNLTPYITIKNDGSMKTPALLGTGHREHHDIQGNGIGWYLIKKYSAELNCDISVCTDDGFSTTLVLRTYNGSGVSTIDIR